MKTRTKILFLLLGLLFIIANLFLFSSVEQEIKNIANIENPKPNDVFLLSDGRTIKYIGQVNISSGIIE